MAAPYDTQLEQLLLSAAAGDKNAEQQFNLAQEQNFLGSLQSLVNIFVADGANPMARQLGGLMIKNSFFAKSEEVAKINQKRWEQLDAAARDSIKNPLLQALRNPERVVSHTAAQAAAEIAAIELPYEEWPAFLPSLLENVRDPKYPDSVKAASLECLGYSCDRIATLDKVVDEKTTDGMLNVIIDGISANRPNQVRLAAAAALRNSLGFAEKNMEKPEECTAIMNAIMEATRSQDPQVRMMAYEAIVQVAVLYYGKLQEFMTNLYQLTTTTIQSDTEDNVVKSAIEFWTSLCEVEQDLIDEAQDLQARGLQPETTCMQYVAAATTHLVPILVTTLTKQEENADEDEFTVHMAGQLCLTNIAQTVEDVIVPVLVPFIQQNIQSPEWRLRDAAIMAFISELEGPSQATIGPYVQQSVPILLPLLNDENEIVRDSAAHCISRICLLHVQYIPGELFPAVMQALDAKIKEGSPKVASQAASAIFNLAQAFRSTEEQETNILSQYMQGLLTSLLSSADRPDGDESNLRVACMEAISELISVAAQDVRPMLSGALPEFLSRFEQTFNMSVLSPEEKNRRDQIQGLLSAVIQSLYRQLDKPTVAPHTDRAMYCLMQVLSNKSSNIQEECFSAISAIADVIEADFATYMDQLIPLLLAGLKNFSAYQVCIVAVGTVGDISRNIEGRIQPYCDSIMAVLIECLKDQSIHRSVKPPVLSCFGDIAMAIGGAFQPYLQLSMMMLMQAGSTKVENVDDDIIDYLNMLRESVLEAYVGIIQGLRDGNVLQEFGQYVGPVLHFLSDIAQDPHRDDYVLSKAVGLLGDIAMTMTPILPQLKTELNQPFAAEIVREAISSADQNTVETAQWASQILNQAINSS
ncbi:heat repeat-containing protein [Nitzschia inconspicua]|uniref:Heat repeat-containing protein n=1 Tax=Nitzschia inconspicua TaxID=303405 RepID=A0A9K3M4L0_9STRA|nr:heat repeat-containing protein [Nitzschia inconspicua]